MDWTIAVYAVPTFLAGLISASLAWFGWKHRSEPVAIPFLVLMVGLFIWSLGYGIELIVPTVSSKLFWDGIAFIGSAIVPTAWLVLAVVYAGKDDLLSKRSILVLTIEPLAVILLVWTNDRHHLIWQEATLDASSHGLTPTLTFGPAYWANLGYSYLLMAVGLGILIWVAVRSTRVYRKQSVVLILSSSVPLGANVLFNALTTLNPVPELDLTTVAFAVSSVFFALALFQYRMLDLVPEARNTLFEDLDDRLIVLDTANRVVDVNPPARRILGANCTGAPLEETCLGRPIHRDDEIVTINVDETSRTFDVRSTTLTDFTGRDVGRIIIMHDITELRIIREHEQRLNVLHRVLRHNIRNDMNVVIGNIDLLSGDLADEQRERAKRARDYAMKTVTTSEKARHIESVFEVGRIESKPIELSDALGATVDSFSERYPDVRISTHIPDSVTVTAIGSRALSILFSNLIENAIEHNPADDRQVIISSEFVDDRIVVRVADNGPGIPQNELTPLIEGTETPLNHGSGIGLWLVNWVINASNGHLAFKENTPEGSIVEVSFQTETGNQQTKATSVVE